MLLRMYSALGRGARLQARVDRGEPGRGGRHQVGHHQGRRRQRLWLAQDRERRAPPGADLAVRQPGAPAHQLRLRLGLSGGRRHDRDRDQRQGPADRHLPRVGRRRPARQQDRQRGPPHPSADRDRGRLPERPLAAPQPRAGLRRCCAPGSTSSSCRSGATRPRPRPPARATSAGATRSAPTSCSPTRWSRTCAPGSRRATPQGVLDGDLDDFLEAALAQGVGGKETAAVN